MSRMNGAGLPAPNDPLRNKNDPLHNQESAARELFKRLSPQCTGFPAEAVISSALNLLVNGLRQTNPARNAALSRYDEWTQRFRAILAEHYVTDGSKRKNVFPHEQIITPPFHDDKDWTKVR